MQPTLRWSRSDLHTTYVESALCMVNLQHMFYLQHDFMFEGVLCMVNLQHNI